MGEHDIELEQKQHAHSHNRNDSHDDDNHSHDHGGEGTHKEGHKRPRNNSKVENDSLLDTKKWYQDKNQRILAIVASMTFLFCGVEIAFGIIVHSLALVSDSFHMISDVLSLIVGFVSISLSRKRSDAKSYGWVRAEVIGGLVNGVFLIAVSFFISIEAIQRFLDPEITIDHPLIVIVVGASGLAVNIIGMLLFASHRTMGGGGHGHSHSHGHNHGHEKKHGHEHGHGGKEKEVNGDSATPEEQEREEGSANLHAIFLHLLGDALGSLGAMATGFIILFSDSPYRFYCDPALTIFFAIIILRLH